MLPARVFAPLPPVPEQEDIFASGISILFTDDTQNSHGLPGHSVIYTSPALGDVTLNIPEHPDVEEGRRLFAHFLWNAAVIVAEAIESSNFLDHESSNNDVSDEGKVKWNKRYWGVKDRDVLEFGAGTALPSIIAGLFGARSLTVTDHPSSPALITKVITKNIEQNLKLAIQSSGNTEIYNFDADSTQHESRNLNEADTSGFSDPSSTFNQTPLKLLKDRCRNVSIHGLVWGTPTFYSSNTLGKLSIPQPEHCSFDKIIVADCLWMANQHVNIIKTIHTYLRPSSSTETNDTTSESNPCALVVAGFHTGRATVARFIGIATGSRAGTRGEREGQENGGGSNLAEDEEEKEDMDESVREVRGILRAAEIFEVDVDCNVRAWLPERPTESREQARRWCVCAVLVKR